MRTVAMLPLPGSCMGMFVAGRVVGVVEGPTGGLLIVESGNGGGDLVTTVSPGAPISDEARFVGACLIYGAPHAVYAVPA